MNTKLLLYGLICASFLFSLLNPWGIWLFFASLPAGLWYEYNEKNQSKTIDLEAKVKDLELRLIRFENRTKS